MKSKFDDQSDVESDIEPSQLSDEQDDADYLADTPPMSPVELKPELPPFFPALQVSSFSTDAALFIFLLYLRSGKQCCKIILFCGFLLKAMNHKFKSIN